MNELASKTCLVWDHGLDIGLAERLSRDDGFGRVLYHSPYQEGFSLFDKAILGWGVGRIERCNDPWRVKKEVDCFVFTDIEHSGEQEELESQGFAVWGARRGDSLELNRQKFHKILGDVGLDVPKFDLVMGITKLKEYLKANDKPCYIKSERFRGSWETVHFRSWKLDEGMINFRHCKLGKKGDLMDFLVFEPIETKLEIGGDTWNIDGGWPLLMLHGDEAKDKAYLSAVTKRTDMPPQIQEILSAFGPVLKPYRYRQFWSMEDRVKGLHHYFGDATTRGPFPASASHMEIWKNFPMIIWAGAHGELIEPEAAAKFTCEVMVNIKAEEGMEATAEFPEELKQWLKPADCYVIDGVLCIVPEAHEAGWMVAIDDTVEGVIEKQKAQCDLLPDGMSADMEPLAELLQVVNEAEDKGIEFSPEVPGPEIVLAESGKP